MFLEPLQQQAQALLNDTPGMVQIHHDVLISIDDSAPSIIKTFMLRPTGCERLENTHALPKPLDTILAFAWSFYQTPAWCLWVRHRPDRDVAWIEGSYHSEALHPSPFQILQASPASPYVLTDVEPHEAEVFALLRALPRGWRHDLYPSSTHQRLAQHQVLDGLDERLRPALNALFEIPLLNGLQLLDIGPHRVLMGINEEASFLACA